MRAGEARNRCEVYRRDETRDSYADVLAGYAATAEQAWVDIRRDVGALVDFGPGEESRGPAKGRAHFLTDIAERDVLKVLDGPDAGTQWLVAAVFHPGGRDKDLALERFTGSLS